MDDMMASSSTLETAEGVSTAMPARSKGISDARSRIFKLRVTDAEHDRIMELAASAGISASEIVRSNISDPRKRIHSRVDAQAVVACNRAAGMTWGMWNELRAGQFDHLAPDSKRRIERELVTSFVALKKDAVAIRKMFAGEAVNLPGSDELNANKSGDKSSGSAAINTDPTTGAPAIWFASKSN